jgi:hypothetical protein
VCYDCPMNSLSVLLWFVFQLAKAAPVPGLPTEEGVYYRPDGAKWVHLAPAPVADTKTRGLGMYIETDGLTNLEMSIVCRGAQASLRISNPKPTFYVRGIGPSNDMMLVQLTRKKNSRTIRTSSSDSTVTNKEGFRRTDVRKLKLTEYTDGTYSATPEENLKKGEYLLVFGTATAGFDFGID